MRSMHAQSLLMSLGAQRYATIFVAQRSLDAGNLQDLEDAQEHITAASSIDVRVYNAALPGKASHLQNGFVTLPASLEGWRGQRPPPGR